MIDTSRRAVIAARLSEHVLYTLGCAAVTPSRDAWQQFDVPSTYRFGWSPPIMMDDDPFTLLVSYCPELIDAVTEHLDDDDLDCYLSLVEQFMEAWVENPTLDPDDVYQNCQNGCDVEAMVLKDRVELRALDHGIVTRGA